MFAEISIGCRIGDVFVYHLLLGLEGRQFYAVDVLAPEFGEA